MAGERPTKKQIQSELERLYVERDAQLLRYKKAQEKADLEYNKLFEIKDEIKRLHRKVGQRG